MNCVLMHLRKRVANQVSLEEIMQTGEEPGRTRKELGHYDLRLTGLIDRLSIEKAIAQLSARLKRTFVLCDLWGCEHGEVAQILDCPAGTSKSRLHKARRRLRELLLEYQPTIT